MLVEGRRSPAEGLSAHQCLALPDSGGVTSRPQLDLVEPKRALLALVTGSPSQGSRSPLRGWVQGSDDPPGPFSPHFYRVEGARLILHHLAGPQGWHHELLEEKKKTQQDPVGCGSCGQTQIKARTGVLWLARHSTCVGDGGRVSPLTNEWGAISIARGKERDRK